MTVLPAWMISHRWEGFNASAEEDLWADPRGEFLSLLHASQVYELVAGEGLAVETKPEVETPVTGRLGYHIRRGEHDVTRYDWERFLGFTDRFED